MRRRHREGMTVMGTRSVVVRICGNPFALSALAPDRVAASTAGCLLAAGHDTQVWDLGTVDTLARLYPERHRDSFERLADRMMAEGAPSPFLVLNALWQRRGADRAFRQSRSQLLAELAETLAGQRGLHFAIFVLGALEDVTPALETAARLKELRPTLPLLALGPVVDLLWNELADSAPGFDCYMGSDAEAVLPAWAEWSHMPERWAQLPNLVYAAGRGVRATGRALASDMASLPQPAYHSTAYPALAGDQKLKLFVLEDSRGCACRCHACPVPGRGQGLRLLPPGHVYETMLQVGADYGARAFHIEGAGAPGTHAVAVGQALMAGGLSVEYSRTLPVGLVDSPSFTRLRASGCQAVSFRVDTGSQRLLDGYFGRGVGVSQIEQVLRAARFAGLFTVSRLTYPCPGDDHHTRAETLRLLDRTHPHAAPVDVPALLPGTMWYSQPAVFGFGAQPRRMTRWLLGGSPHFPLGPGRWRSLPFRVGAMAGPEAVAANESLAFEISGRGILTWCPEEFAMIARFAGNAGNERAFSLQLQRHFLMGALTGIGGLVVRFNRAACSPSHAYALRRFAQVQAVVGN